MTETFVLEKISNAQYEPITFETMVELWQLDELQRVSLESILKKLEATGQIIETKKGKYMLPERRGLLAGVLEAHEKGFAFFKGLGRRKEVFIPHKDLAGALDKDRVLIALEPHTTGKNMEGKVIKILSRGTKGFIGKTLFYRNRLIVEPENRRVFGRYSIVDAPEGLKAKERVFVAIEDYAVGKKLGSVKILNHLPEGDVTSEAIIQSILLKYGLEDVFPDKVERAAEGIPQVVEGPFEAYRKDLKQTYMVTIDGEDAKDFDDAVSLSKDDDGHYHLGVHIADVSHYVEEGSVIDKEAFKRATSIYFPGKVLPMLPFSLSNGICSLNAGEDRMAMSCQMVIDSQGKVISHEIHPSVIRVAERMTYTNVAALLKGEDEELKKRYEKGLPMFLEMAELAKILEQRRVRRGAILFDLPELKVNVDPTGVPISLTKRMRNQAESLIEEFMLAANETVAEHLFWMQWPCVYRIHEAPPNDGVTHFNEVMAPFGFKIVPNGAGEVHPKEYQKLINQIKDHPMKEMIMTLLLRSMSHARYDVNPLGHFGLSVTYYCHFTSPIRRYPDLAVHRSLKAIFMNQGEVEKKQLGARNFSVATHSSERELIAESVEREVTNLKVVEYMVPFVGDTFDARVSGMIFSGLFVQLENLAEGFIPFSTLVGYHTFSESEMLVRDGGNQVAFRIGDKVHVKLVAANLELGHLDFVIEDLKNETSRK